MLGAVVVAVTGTNIPLFIAIHHACAVLPAAFWQTVTLFGNALVALVICAVWLRRRPSIVWAGILAAIPGSIISRLFKMTFDVPRPLALIPDEVRPLGPAYQHTSFPSGDALTIFVLAAVACAAYRTPRARALILAGAALVAVSRIAMGVHWPIDVLSGAAAGWVCGCVGLSAANRLTFTDSARMRLALAAVLFACSVALVFQRASLPLADPVRYAIAALGCVLSAAAIVAQVRLRRESRVSP
jgi:membrane-associated phospholipid phosphatase